MGKFTDLVQEKIEQIKLNEAVPTASGTIGGAAGTAPVNTAGAPAQAMQQTTQAQSGAQGATATNTAGQPQQQNPNTPASGPEQHFINAFKTTQWNNPTNAVKALNTAFKNAGNVPGMAQFFQNIGFDPNQGFVYNPNVQPTNGRPVAG